MQQEPSRFVSINARQSIQEIHTLILKTLKGRLPNPLP